jgi:hypothetical protein
MKKRFTAIAIILTLGISAFVAYGFLATCWFHDHSYMKASPTLMRYIDSMELEWYLEDGYAGRIFTDHSLTGGLEGHTVDYDISALINGKNLFQRRQKDIEIAGFGYSRTTEGILPVAIGWSDSQSIKEAADSGEDVVLVAVVRIKNSESEIVYHGFLRSSSLKQANKKPNKAQMATPRKPSD